MNYIGQDGGLLKRFLQVPRVPATVPLDVLNSEEHNTTHNTQHTTQLMTHTRRFMSFFQLPVYLSICENVSCFCLFK